MRQSSYSLKSFGSLSKQHTLPTSLHHISLVENIQNSLHYFYSLPSVIRSLSFQHISNEEMGILLFFDLSAFQMTKTIFFSELQQNQIISCNNKMMCKHTLCPFHKIRVSADMPKQNSLICPDTKKSKVYLNCLEHSISLCQHYIGPMIPIYCHII